LIDFHSHLVPGVDDGAADVEQARAAVAEMRGHGVHTAITTPHLSGALTAHPEELRARLDQVEAAWKEVRAIAAAEEPALRLELGAEVMLNTDTPDLSDPRTRLAGTPFALVEFPRMLVPVTAEQTLSYLLERGWTPIVAHPERYPNLHEELRDAAEWRRMGARLQVNAGSLLGRFGREAQGRAWRLLRLGWVDYLASDYHARGRLALAGARDMLRSRGGEEQAALLLETNAARLLQGETPLEVPPLEVPPPLWKRILGLEG
jgi:protein-tyrosine phosphatase